MSPAFDGVQLCMMFGHFRKSTLDIIEHDKALQGCQGMESDQNLAM